MESLCLEIQCQKYKELAEEPKSFINRPKEVTGDDHHFQERRTNSNKKLQTSSRKVQTQVQRTAEEAERSHEQSKKGKRQVQSEYILPTRLQDF
ncbi:hypothetical protein O181_006264 [Austropuccinia psidii MF-1]|uniref:Uncharacterized protein n=1 Tax=Austropuccinia psidii MF-1 TaxID=1389203 RepID=A0A9Q3BJR8_9BASI|nr:hypothetical protein [Austropuccinia psidii MF-1]